MQRARCRCQQQAGSTESSLPAIQAFYIITATGTAAEWAPTSTAQLRHSVGFLLFLILILIQMHVLLLQQAQQRNGPGADVNSTAAARQALDAQRRRPEARALSRDEEDYFAEVSCGNTTTLVEFRVSRFNWTRIGGGLRRGRCRATRRATLQR